MKKIFIILVLLLVHSSILSQKEYSMGDICSVLSEFLMDKEEQSIREKDKLSQYLFIEEIVYKDQCFKRDFGAYVFYLTTVDPPRRYILIKNNSNYVIIDFRIEDFLDCIYRIEGLSIDNDALISYIREAQNMDKHKFHSIENVTTDGKFVYFKTERLG